MNVAYAEAIIQNDNIDNAILDFMCFEGNKYIFGNSLQTAVTIGLMRALDVQMSGLILPYGDKISMRKGFWKQMMQSLNVIDIGSIQDKKLVYIMVADSQDSLLNNCEKLYSLGYNKLIGCCWKHNSDMMQIACEYFYEKQKGNC